MTCRLSPSAVTRGMHVLRGGGRVTLGSVLPKRVLVGMPPACAPAQADELSAGGHQGTRRAESGADRWREGSGSYRSAAEGNRTCLQTQFPHV